MARLEAWMTAGFRMVDFTRTGGCGDPVPWMAITYDSRLVIWVFECIWPLTIGMIPFTFFMEISWVATVVGESNLINPSKCWQRAVITTNVIGHISLTSTLSRHIARWILGWWHFDVCQGRPRESNQPWQLEIPMNEGIVRWQHHRPTSKSHASSSVDL